jgi:hypothetical protein
VRVVFRELVAWPGALRTTRAPSPFTAGWHQTMSKLSDEVRHLGGDQVVVEVAAACYADGNGPKPSARWAHPGVVVSFEGKFGPQRFHTDAHSNRPGYLPGWQANVRAVALGLQALRAVDRYGITSAGEQYRGFGALPSATPMGSGVWDGWAGDVLGAAEFLADQSDGMASAADVLADPSVARDVFRVAAKRLHPDQGGSEVAMRKLVAARDLVLSTG